MESRPWRSSRDQRAAGTLESARSEWRKAGRPQERKQAQEQMLDIMKMVPAGMIATASALSPLPMTLVFTPVVLRKLGLLPPGGKRLTFCKPSKTRVQDCRPWASPERLSD